MCTILLPPGVNLIAVNKYIDIYLNPSPIDDKSANIAENNVAIFLNPTLT